MTRIGSNIALPQVYLRSFRSLSSSSITPGDTKITNYLKSATFTSTEPYITLCVTQTVVALGDTGSGSLESYCIKKKKQKTMNPFRYRIYYYL